MGEKDAMQAEIDELRAENAVLKRTDIIDLLQANNEMLAELAALKKQEPIGHVTDQSGHVVWYGYYPPPLHANLYLAVGARPTRDLEPKPTGWDNGLSQDYNKELGKWFANQMGARQQLVEALEVIGMEKKGNE